MTRLAALVTHVVPLVMLILSLINLSAAADSAAPALRVRTLSLRHQPAAVFVLPQEHLTLSFDAPASELHILAASLGKMASTGPNRWTWEAPLEPGRYPLEIRGPNERGAFKLTAIVMVPSSRVRDGWLNGYRIGAYPAKPLNGNPIYNPPRGFIEVTRDDQDVRISPHFQLRQFLSKQAGDFPKYLILDERLVFLLEALGERLESVGYDADDIHVMSGFRTPAYNRQIDNVQYSLHQWGRAADIFLDKDDNSWMDDVNKDGRIDRQDAVALSEILDTLSKTPELSSVIGGIGVYGATAAHGPFVHVDTRGTRARW